MVEETRQIPTYALGDTIRIELDVSDRSGVTDVAANFTLTTDVTREIWLNADAAGATDAIAVLEQKVAEGLTPGEYDCQFVSIADRLGNRTLVSRPGIRFRVEGVPGDHEGPELRGWREEPGLSYTQKYLVPLITDEEGNTTGVHYYHQPGKGYVLWLFTSHERGNEFMSALKAEPGEGNKAFMEILEQGWGQLASDDVNIGDHFSAKTVPEIAKDLERWEVGRLMVDPGFAGWQQRIYEVPHKS